MNEGSDTNIKVERPESKHITYKEHLYIEHMFKCLSPEGKGYMVMGKGLLFRRKEKEESRLFKTYNSSSSVISSGISS